MRQLEVEWIYWTPHGTLTCGRIGPGRDKKNAMCSELLNKHSMVRKDGKTDEVVKS